MARRAHVEAAARRGNAEAEAALIGPDMPLAFAYLREWVYQLHGRSGVGMSGVAPLSFGTIADWARLRDITLEPHEVDALIALDAVLLHPEPDEKAPAAERTPTFDRAQAWPTRTSEG